MTGIYKRILLVDDDLTANHINQIFLRKSLHPAELEIISFDKPRDGLNFLLSLRQYVPTVLLLDINMPEISGWDFLHFMSDFPKEMLDAITTYVLSSSIDKEDMQKADTSPLVKGFLSKPLSAHISRIFNLEKNRVEVSL